MSSATGRKPTDAGSLLTGRRRLPPGDAANAANPVNAQHLPDCSTADSPAPQALSTSFLPTLPRQATPDVLSQHPTALPPFLKHKKIATRFRMTTFQPLFFLTAIQNMIPTLTQTITFPFLFYSGFHPDIFPKIPAYSPPAVEYFQE